MDIIDGAIMAIFLIIAGILCFVITIPPSPFGEQMHIKDTIEINRENKHIVIK